MGDHYQWGNQIIIQLLPDLPTPRLPSFSCFPEITRSASFSSLYLKDRELTKCHSLSMMSCCAWSSRDVAALAKVSDFTGISAAAPWLKNVIKIFSLTLSIEKLVCRWLYINYGTRSLLYSKEKVIPFKCSKRNYFLLKSMKPFTNILYLKGAFFIVHLTYENTSGEILR